MEDLLAKLVAIPTITDDLVANQQALDYIGGYLQERGMYIKRYTFDGHGALVATTKPEAKHARVMLHAHTDVMSATEQAFTMRQEGDKLFGRGVYDMKFAIAGYMMFVDCIQHNLTDYDFSIILTTDEEYGSRDGINSWPHLLKLGYGADVAIVPDGGMDWNVEYMYKGHWRFDMVAAGKSGHSSRPWLAESASFKLVQALHELRTAFDGHGPETDTLNIGNIHADGTYNQIPSQMTAAVEIRLASGDSLKKNKALLENICDTFDVTVIDRAIESPVEEDVNFPLIREFMHSITRVTGHQSKPCLSMASSDAVYLRRAGIPCAVTYLPGGGHHSENEWIERKALLQFPDVIRDYVERNAKAGQSDIHRARQRAMTTTTS